MKKGFIIGFSIFFGIFALFAAVIILFYIHLSNSMKWSVHDPMTAEQQVKLSSMALIPAVADQLERYGDRGLRDSEYMAESYLYDDVDDMIASLPEGYAPYVEYALKVCSISNSRLSILKQFISFLNYSSILICNIR